jgi:predicted transcriptional regulator
MSMYNLTRQEVADKLNISTRSVDRYINAWKLRAKKDWKVVYVNQSDVDKIAWTWDSRQEVIVEQKVVNNTENQKSVSRNDWNVSWTLWYIYKDLKEEIQKKDELIQNLAMRVWKAEEIAKNSVSLLDFKKSQYLLEESKETLNKNLENLETENEKLAWELKYEKTTNLILIIFVLLLLAIAWTIWFMKI